MEWFDGIKIRHADAYVIAKQNAKRFDLHLRYDECPYYEHGYCAKYNDTHVECDANRRLCVYE